MHKRVFIILLITSYTCLQGAAQGQDLPPSYHQSEIQNAVDTLAALMQGNIEPQLTIDQLQGLIQFYTEIIIRNQAVNLRTTHNESLLELARSNNQFHIILSQLELHQNDYQH